MSLVIRARTMLDTAWHHERFARPEFDIFAVAKLDHKPPGKDEKEVVSVVMFMLDELAAA